MNSPDTHASTFATVFVRTMLLFLPIAVGLTLIAGLGYVNVQQALRLGANEPQEWLAESVLVNITNGMSPVQAASSTSLGPVEISTDPAPYIVIYDASGKPIAGNGYLHGVLPVLPQGVLTSAEEAHLGLLPDRNFLTWQPEPDIRQAIVIDPILTPTGGYVVSGRSLAYVEDEEQALTVRTFVGWVAAMLGTFIFCLFSAFSLYSLRFKK